MDGRRNGLVAMGLALVLGMVSPGLAQEATEPARTRHPEILDVMNWKAATYLLDSGGRVKDPNAYARLRESLNNQSARFIEEFGPASDHGLREGQVPPRSFCVPSGVRDDSGAFYAPASHNGMFDAAVLLGEVAVEATVGDVIPGFSGTWPYNLLAVSNVVPLHGLSPSPDYVLIPVFSMVTHDRVFCGGERDEPFVAGVDYKIGTRLVIIGSWHDGVVPMGVGEGSSGILAEVQEEGTLEWLFSVSVDRPDPPGTLLGLTRRIGELASGGLLATTAAVRRERELYSEGRGELGDLVSSLYWSGCRLVGAEPLALPDNGRRYTRICAEGTPEVAARKLDRPLAEICIDASTTRSTSTGDGWGAAESCAVEQ